MPVGPVAVFADVSAEDCACEKAEGQVWEGNKWS